MKIAEKLIVGNDFSILSKIRSDNNPILLWGMGDVAGIIIKYLRREGIDIYGIVLNEITESTWNGLPVYKFGDSNLPDSYSVVVGHSHYEYENVLKKCDCRIAEIYLLFEIGAYETSTWNRKWILDNINLFEEICDLLADELSQNTLVALINSAINDNPRYLFEYVINGQNFFDNSVWKIGKNESYIDIGAYKGDTILDFIRECDNEFSWICAFEPDQKNYDDIIKIPEIQSDKRIQILKLGTWNSFGMLAFDSEGNQESRINEKGNCMIQVVSLDDYLPQCSPSIIKINIGPGKLETIDGAKKIIQKNKPKLVINIGYSSSAMEVLDVIKNIKIINPSYRVFLRLHSALVNRLVMYAIE